MKRGADIDDPFGYYRHVLVRRVWELVLECEDHRHQFAHLLPSKSQHDPYRHMDRDPGGHRRIALEDEFLTLYPSVIDCPDGCSTALYYIIEDLRRYKAELVQENAGLAYQFAYKNAWRGKTVGMELQDLVQHGLIGLAEGVERYQQEKGFTFSTYGTWWIKHSIIRAIDNGGLVRVPVHRQYRRKDKYFAPVVSLDAKLTDEEGAKSYLDMLEDEGVESAQDQLSRHYDAQQLLQLVSQLKEREQSMLRMRFGLPPHAEPHTLQQVGEAHGLTRERVRQIEVKTLLRLRKRMRLAS